MALFEQYREDIGLRLEGKFAVWIANLKTHLEKTGRAKGVEPSDRPEFKYFLEAEKYPDDIKQIIQREVAWRIYRPIEANCIRIDDNGNPHVNYEVLVDYIIEKYLPLTLGRDRPVIWIWTGSKWRENNGIIEQDIKRHLENYFTEKQIRSHVNETLFRVQVDTKAVSSDFEFNKNMKRFIPVANGTIDTERQDLLPHCFDFMFNFYLPVNYDPYARCNKIDTFINEVVTEENRDILYEIPARALLGWTHEAFMLLGSGRNGKSTYLKILTRFLGSENVSSVPLQKICDERFAAADLQYKIANLCADIPKKPLKYTGYFKMVTGDDRIYAEKKFRDPFYFTNKAVLVFTANELPEVNDVTYAFWARWIVIEFPKTFSENKNLINELTTEEELSGFLNKVLEYRRRLLNGQLSKSKRVEDIMKLWMAQANSVWAFKDNCLEQDPQGEVVHDELYQKYIEFCESKDLKTFSKPAFSIELQRLMRTTKRRKRVGGEPKFVWGLIKLKCDKCTEKCSGEEQTAEIKTEEMSFDLGDVLKGSTSEL
jgi:putative DNA primase/helicase